MTSAPPQHRPETVDSSARRQKYFSAKPVVETPRRAAREVAVRVAPAFSPARSQARLSLTKPAAPSAGASSSGRREGERLWTRITDRCRRQHRDFVQKMPRVRSARLRARIDSAIALPMPRLAGDDHNLALESPMRSIPACLCVQTCKVHSRPDQVEAQNE